MPYLLDVVPLMALADRLQLDDTAPLISLYRMTHGKLTSFECVVLSRYPKS